jgi:putative ABC transport system substrate-binding protein
MERRAFVAGAAALIAAPLAAEAQQAGRVHRIGILSSGSPPPGFLEQLDAGLRERGYVDGRNVHIELRQAQGRNEALAALAEELVQREVDVIVTLNTPAALAAKGATTTIPIVMTRVSDPIGSGLVRSLAAPGGNLTGLSFSAVEVAPKMLQLLKETISGLSLVGFVWYADNAAARAGIEHLEFAAMQIKLPFLLLPVRAQSDLAGVLGGAARRRVQAIVVFEDVWLTNHRVELVRTAATHSLPVVSLYKDFPEAGALFAYGASPAVIYRRTAYYVDRILKGTKPAELPIEQPTKFDLIVNLRTAKALGLTIPQSLLLRADQLIE